LCLRDARCVYVRVAGLLRVHVLPASGPKARKPDAKASGSERI